MKTHIDEPDAAEDAPATWADWTDSDWDPGTDPLGAPAAPRRRIAGIDIEGRFAQTLSRARYIGADATVGIRRRGGLAASVVLTIALCATMAGASLLARDGIDDTLGRWADGVEFVVYLEPGAAESETARIREALESNGAVRNVEGVSQDEAFTEFTELYAERPQMVEAVTADLLPSSLRVSPTEADPAVIAEITDTLSGDPAIYDVVTADDAVADMRDLSATVSGVGAALAIALAAIAVVLSAAMLRASIAARRDEIAIKSLIGATRRYIAAPIVAEGAVLGAVAAAMSAAALAAGVRATAGADSAVLTSLTPPAHTVTPTLLALATTVTAAATITSVVVVTVTLRRSR